MNKKFWKKCAAIALSCMAAFAFVFSFGACGGSGETGKVDFTKLTYVAFGDSITFGEVGSTQEQMEKPYPNLVSETLKFKAVRNYGERNATIKYIETKPNLLTKVAGASSKADIVSVLIGINDFGAGCKLGTVEDNSCVNSVYGGFNELANTLHTKYPDAFIFFMTPLTPFKADFPKTNSAGYTLVELCNVIKEVGERNNIAVLDLNETSGFSSETDPHCADGLHPSQYFFTEYMAPQIAQFIQENYAK